MIASRSRSDRFRSTSISAECILRPRDAFRSAGVAFGYTHGHSLRLRFSFLRIDHILVSGGIGLGNSFAGGDRASEHRPVIADLLLRPQR